MDNLADLATVCSYCEADWFAEPYTHFGLDVRLGEREAFITWQACCEGVHNDVTCWGYEFVYGRTVTEVVREFSGIDVLEILDHGDGCIVARLAVANPTELDAKRDGEVRRDRHGNAKTKSPKGWQDEVFADIEAHHSHHEAPNGWKFGVAVYNGPVKVGVMTIGIPGSRLLMQAEPHTLEVTRGCVLPVRRELRKNVSSKLYAAACKQAKTLGYTKLITYTMEKESGHSLVASGWTATRVTDGGSHDRPNRRRVAKHRKYDTTGRKVRWEKGLNKRARKEVAVAALFRLMEQMRLPGVRA